MNRTENFTHCHYEGEILGNYNKTFENKTANDTSTIDIVNFELQTCQHVSEDLNKQIVKLEDEYKILRTSYDSYQMNNLLIPIEFIIISLIRKTETGRQNDFCIGLSTNFGFMTENSCCQAEEISIFSLESASEITFENSSIWIEKSLCLLNTTEKIDFNFPISDVNKTLECSFLAFDTDKSHFRKIRLDINPLNCFEGSCLSNIDPSSLTNMILLDGLSVMCPHSLDFGMVQKCKFSRRTLHSLTFIF